MATATRSSLKSFTIPAPTTAREAQELANRLAEQESALARAQREARNDAKFEAAEHVLAVDAAQAAADRDQAVIAWNATAARGDSTLDELFRAFVAMREASARRAAIVAQADALMTSLKPRRSEVSGQPISYRNDVHDYLAQAEFGKALEDVIKGRASAAAGGARTDVQTRITDAGEQAAAQAVA